MTIMKEHEVSPRLFVTGGRDYSVDILRCLSCFIVCMRHAPMFSLENYYGIAIGGTALWKGIVFDICLASSPTVLFVMVSGIFFLTPQRNVTPRKIWTKNVPKMACAYVFWSLVYALYRIYFEMTPQPVTVKLVVQQWLVQPGHLWYIPMIITLYILVPFFRCITQYDDKKLYKYGLILFIGAIFFNTLDTGIHGLPYGGYLGTILDKTPVDDICQYSFWMVLGYYLYTHRPKASIRKIIYVAGIISVFVAFAICLWNFAYNGDYRAEGINAKFTLTSFFKNVAIFLAITNGFANVKLSERGKKILTKLSNCTLMIYLVHYLMLYICYDFGIIIGWNISPLVAVWIMGITVYILGGLLGAAFQAVPWKKMRNSLLDMVFPNRTVLVTRKK